MRKDELPANDPEFYYYDSDYPWTEGGECPSNWDDDAQEQCLADVPRYLEIAAEVGGPILELCCGTGRVALPLARAGHQITGVDLSGQQLEQFRHNLARQEPQVRERVELVQQDVTQLDLGERTFGLAILAFNSLIMLSDFEKQRQALQALTRHMEVGGRVVIDVLNPMQLDIHGDNIPRPFVTRTNPRTGNTYTRFGMASPFDADQVQRLYGWYDELDAEGRVYRRNFSWTWRPVFRHELVLMLNEAGFTVESLEGGHNGEEYHAGSRLMFFQATYSGDDIRHRLAKMERQLESMMNSKS